jgi:hypothetical protein
MKSLYSNSIEFSDLVVALMEVNRFSDTFWKEHSELVYDDPDIMDNVLGNYLMDRSNDELMEVNDANSN